MRFVWFCLTFVVGAFKTRDLGLPVCDCVCGKHTTNDIVADYSDEEDNEGCDDEAGEDEASAGSGRVVQTVPAREPRLDAVPLKSALKKPGGEHHPAPARPQPRQGGAASTPPQEKNQNSR